MSASPDWLHAMKLAIIDGNIKKVRLLLKAGVPPTADVNGFTFLQLAAALANEEIFYLLVEAGADTSHSELLTTAADGNSRGGPTSPRIVQDLLSTHHYDQVTLDDALRYSCITGNLDIIRMLVEAGSNPNSVNHLGAFPLRNAVQEGHLEAVQYLIGVGASPTANTIVEETDEETVLTMTLVEFALYCEWQEIARHLHDLGGSRRNLPYFSSYTRQTTCLTEEQSWSC